MSLINKIQWDVILTGLILFFVISIIGGGSLFLPKIYYKFLKKTDGNITVQLPEPENISKESIQAVKGTEDSVLKETEDFKKISIYSKPLETPVFVSNSEKLTKYLEQNAVEIVAEGTIEKAYLYAVSGSLDINKESIFFWIVDGESDGGHLVPSESYTSGKGNEFLYDLRKLPLVERPYFPNKPAGHVDIVSKYLNKDISYKTKRQYFVGAFVSTTTLPNQISKLEIRYRCELGSNCRVYSPLSN